MKIMKTKIRTIIGIVALGTIGFANINATADNKREVNTNVVTEKEESLTIESWMTEESNWTSETEVDTLNVEEALEVETWMINEDLWK
jgi:hypothetical protein